MRSIAKKVSETYTIKHSRFHATLYPVYTVEDAQSILAVINADYADASHRCFAYIIGDHQEHQKADDDGEPSKTAGFPILDALKKNDVTNVLCVVVRYYGGVKLGAGGLIRAYGKGASLCLENAVFTHKVMLAIIQVRVAFDYIGVLEYLVAQETLLERTYTDQVTFTIKMKQARVEAFEALIHEKTKGQGVVSVVKTEKTYQ